MQDKAFRAFAAARLSPKAVDSYLSNCRYVERITGHDLTGIPLADNDIQAILGRLGNAGTPAARVSDCGSALRMYARYRADDPITASPPAPARSTPGKPASDLTGLSAQALLVLQAAVIDEFRRRGIARTGNGPLGDYAETLFARAFGWTLEANSAAGHDATDAAGIRYQIKGRRVTAATPSRQLGAIRQLPERPFDYLAAVLFDGKFDILRAVLIPVVLVIDVAKPSKHTNSWRVMLSDRLIAAKGVRDVTKQISDANRLL